MSDRSRIQLPNDDLVLSDSSGELVWHGSLEELVSLVADRFPPDFPSDDDVRSDAVLDWMEIHLRHYDWNTAIESVSALLQAVADTRRVGE